MPVLTWAGVPPLRPDARQPTELPFQRPPRNKRYVPVVGPVGFVSGLEA